jgi:hypothetical protein
MPWTVWKRLAIRLEPRSVWPEARAPSAASSEFENNNRRDVIIWCAYGQQEAGQETFRASCSVDPDVRLGVVIRDLVGFHGPASFRDIGLPPTSSLGLGIYFIARSGIYYTQIRDLLYCLLARFLLTIR